MIEPGMARVTVLAGGVPRANHPVTFQRSDSTEIATVMTDASGVAAAMVPEGSYVTAFDIYQVSSPFRSIVTVMGVKPGDSIEIRGDANAPEENIAFTYPAYAGAISYDVASTCAADGVGGSTMPSLSSRPCSPRIDTLVVARDDTGNELAYLAKLDQPFDQVIDLTGETWVMATPVATTYTNVPSFALNRASRRYTTPRGTFGECQAIGYTSGTFTFACPEIAGVTVVEETWLWEDAVGRYVYSPAPAAPIDLTGAAIAAPTDYAYSIPGTRELLWTERAGATPQFVMAQVSGTGGSAPYRWEIVAPYTGSTLPLPTLTGEGEIYNNLEDAGAFVWLGTAEGGYDAIRQLGPTYVGGIRVNAATGRVVLTAYEEG